jgi:GT2 family glycosyltransferase
MSAPDISVIIPTFNRGEELQCCLDRLVSQSLDKARFEVLVVDDGSQPPAGPAANGLRLVVLRQKNRGPAAARNLGASHARGEILAFTDDDCRPQAGWLEALLEAARRQPGALLGGATRNGLQDNPFAEASQLIQDQVYRWYNSSADEAAFFASNNMAAPRRAFLDLGGFNPAFRTAEDRELCDRWRAAGRRLLYVAGAEVIHARRLTLGSFMRQHFAYGRGARCY